MATYYGNQAVGSRARLILGEETVYGTSPAAASSNFMELPFVSESFAVEQDALVSETIRADRQIDDAVPSNERSGGDITTEVYVSRPWTTLLTHLLGEYDEDAILTASLGQSSGAAPSAKRHTIKGSVELPAPAGVGKVALSLEKQFLDVDSFFRIVACRVNSLRMEIPSTGLIRSTWNLLGTAAQTPTSTSYETGSLVQLSNAAYHRTPFTSFQGTVYEGSSVLPTNGYSGAPSGSQTAYLKSVTLEISNNLFADNYVVGQKYRANLLPGRRRISGTAEFLFLNRDQYLKFVNNTASYMVIDIVRDADGGGVLSFANDGPAIRFYLPRIKYVGGSPTPTVPNEGPLTITLPFQALRSDADDTDIIAVIKNDETTTHIS